MTKFEEMCAAFARSRKDYFSYRDKCFAHMSSLVNGFVQHCQIPQDQLRFLPRDKEPKENTLYSLFGAMHLNDDTFWHLGLQITLFEKPNVFPHQPVLMIICVKDADGKLLVKIGPDDKPQEVDLLNDAQRRALFDRMVKGVTGFFEGNLQEFLEKEAPLKTIGFVQ